MNADSKVTRLEPDSLMAITKAILASAAEIKKEGKVNEIEALHTAFNIWQNVLHYGG